MTRSLTPPQDLEAEMSLLGSMMLSRDAIGEVLPIIHRSESERFYRPDHCRLFETLVDMYDRGDPIDLVTLRNELGRMGLLKQVGGVEYIAELAESVPSHLHAEHYARIVRDKGLKRDLIRAVNKIELDAYEDADDTDQILDRAEQILFGVTDQRITHDARPIGEGLPEVVATICSEGGAPDGLPTGFSSLDTMLALQPGALIVVAARPSMGKTSLGLQIADNLASQNVPTGFASMEMSRGEIIKRILSARTGVDLYRIQRGHLNPTEQERIVEAQGQLKDSPLYLDDTPGMSVLELRAKARRLKARFGIRAVFVDYLQLMTGAGRSENRQAEVAGLSRAFKGLARQLNIPVVVLAQLNRNPEGRGDNRPRMSDLRESGAIEQDADAVVLLHRPEYYRREDCPEDKKGICEVIIDKQRNGPTGTVKLWWHGPCARFIDRQAEDEAAVLAAHQAVGHAELVPF